MVSKKGDLTTAAVKGLTDLLNDPGTYVPGRAATAGYTVSQAPARQQTAAAYNQVGGNLDQVYGQAVSQTQAANPQIQAAAQAANEKIAADAAARQQAAAQAGSARVAAQEAAARLMGFQVAPQVSGADAQAQLLSQKLGNNVTAWQGLNSATAATRVNRNNGVAASFQNALAEKRSTLAQNLAAAMSQLADRYVAGRSGTAGHYKGGLTASQKTSLYGRLLSQGNSDRSYDLAVAKYADSVAGKKKGSKSTTTSVNSKGQKTKSTTVTR